MIYILLTVVTWPLPVVLNFFLDSSYYHNIGEFSLSNSGYKRSIGDFTLIDTVTFLAVYSVAIAPVWMASREATKLLKLNELSARWKYNFRHHFYATVFELIAIYLLVAFQVESAGRGLVGLIILPMILFTVNTAWSSIRVAMIRRN